MRQEIKCLMLLSLRILRFVTGNPSTLSATSDSSKTNKSCSQFHDCPRTFSFFEPVFTPIVALAKLSLASLTCPSALDSLRSSCCVISALNSTLFVNCDWLNRVGGSCVGRSWVVGRVRLKIFPSL